MITAESKKGMIALMVGHCAVIVFLVALPVYVGTLIAQLGLEAQDAGGLATLFLAGAAISSLYFAPRFARFNARTVASAGFAIAAIAFLLFTTTRDLRFLATLHFTGGVGAGAALSFTHGTIGSSANPHRLFALAGLAMGLFAVLFLGATPSLVARFGGDTLFLLYAALMTTAALTSAFFFPNRNEPKADTRHVTDLAPFGRAIWFAILAVALLGMTQAMTLSFFERIGIERGFGLPLVAIALSVLGVATLFPAPLAAILQHRVSAATIVCVTPLLQAAFALIMTQTSIYLLYVVSGALMEFNIIFTHTFAFGLLAMMDRTGRAVAGTPAMMMLGAAIGPFIGGVLVTHFGFVAVGYAACILVLLQVLLFSLSRYRSSNSCEKNARFPLRQKPTRRSVN